jgi:hypothetical protein
MTEEQEKNQQYGPFHEADPVDKKEFVIELQHLLRICQEVTTSWYLAVTVNAANNEMAKMLEGYAKQRLTCAGELANMIIEQGESPTESADGQGNSALYSIWHDDLASIIEDNPSSLAQSLQAESLVTRAYSYMLALDLPTDIRNKLNRHCQTILQEHDHDNVHADD